MPRRFLPLWSHHVEEKVDHPSQDYSYILQLCILPCNVLVSTQNLAQQLITMMTQSRRILSWSKHLWTTFQAARSMAIRSGIEGELHAPLVKGAWPRVLFSPVCYQPVNFSLLAGRADLVFIGSSWL